MRPDFITWATSKGGIYLPDKKKPTLATWQPYQVDILRHIFPPGEDRLPYSTIIWSEIKKSGKTLLAAGVQLYFGLFVDVPGEQYVLANDLEGASDRTFMAIRRSLMHATDMGAFKKTDWKIVGTKILFPPIGTEIKALANDYKGGAGGNQSLASIDEVWGFTKQSDLGLLTEFAPVPTRENSMVFYTGYQGYEGESNYWHDLIDGVLEHGHPVEALRHLDNGDGEPACWEDGRTFLLWSHIGRHPWHTPEYLAERKARMPLSEYLRVWENRRVKNVNTLCTEDQWDKLYSADLRALHTDDKRRIVLGADAATKSDCCALVGTTWNAETSKVEQLYSRIWQPEARVPLNLTETIGPEIVRLHREYKIEAVYYDPYQMAAIAEMCRKAGVNMVEFPQTAQRIKSDTHLRDLITGNNLLHYGDEELKTHVTNAVAKVQGERGIRIFKEASSRKVDGAVALGMAALGAVEELARGGKGMTVTENPFFME